MKFFCLRNSTYLLALFVANAIPLILLAFSGVNPNIFFGEGGDRGAEGAEEGGVHWGGVWGGGTAPSREFFFDFGSQNGDLWCILGAIFLQFS